MISVDAGSILQLLVISLVWLMEAVFSASAQRSELLPCTWVSIVSAIAASVLLKRLAEPFYSIKYDIVASKFKILGLQTRHLHQLAPNSLTFTQQKNPVYHLNSTNCRVFQSFEWALFLLSASDIWILHSKNHCKLQKLSTIVVICSKTCGALDQQHQLKHSQ